MLSVRSILFVLLLCLSAADLLSQVDQIADFYGQIQKKNKQEHQTITFVSEEMNLVPDYSKLSQIILVRHGEPALNKKGWRKRKEAIQFTKDYDSVGIYPLEFVPVVLQPNEIAVIYTSSIQRSISTAELVFNKKELQHPDSMFREFERKIFSFPNMKLGLKFWLTTSRILWFMGLNKKGIESFSEAKARALLGAEFLEEEALKEGKTLLVSHGLLNHYLVKYLKKRGWKEVYDGGKGYLSQRLLIKYQ